MLSSMPPLQKPKRRPPAAAKRSVVERCLDGTGEGARSTGPSTTAKAVHTMRARVDDYLNQEKREHLAFVVRRLRLEAPRVAACQHALWVETGRIPSLAGTFKFKNLPGAHLGQSLWQQVAGQLKSWISNAENALFADLNRLAVPNASAPTSAARKRWATWQAEQATKAQERRKNPLARALTPREQRQLTEQARVLRLRSEWAETLDRPVEVALLAFQSLGLSQTKGREALRAAAKTDSRRGCTPAQTPAEALARTVWERVVAQRGAVRWNNLNWLLHPRMTEWVVPGEPIQRRGLDLTAIAAVLQHALSPRAPLPAGASVDDVPLAASGAAGGVGTSNDAPFGEQTSGEFNGQGDASPGNTDLGASSASASKKRPRHRHKGQERRRRRPPMQRLLLLTLPQRKEWPTRANLELDWRLAVFDAPAGLETTKDKAERLAREEEAVAQALANGLPTPVFVDPFKGYAQRIEMHTLALPIFTDKNLDQRPGQRSNSFELLPPRADKRGRSNWQLRIFKTLLQADLQTLLGVEATRRGVGTASIDAGLRRAMTTSVGGEGGTPLWVAQGHKKDPKRTARFTCSSAQAVHGKGNPPPGNIRPDEFMKPVEAHLGIHPDVKTEARETVLAADLHVLLPGWGRTLKPLSDAVVKIAAELQQRGQKKLVGNVRWEAAQSRLSGTIKVQIETSLKRWVRATRPTVVCIEDLNLQGARHGKDGNRLVQYLGHGVMRHWLETHAQMYGFTLHRENAAHSSTQCSACKIVDPEFRQGEWYQCGRCAARIDADTNATIDLRERFWIDRWLQALSAAQQDLLGLQAARIETWMRPPTVKKALEAREVFFADRMRLALAKEHHLLPVAIDRLVRARLRVWRELARRQAAERQQAVVSTINESISGSRGLSSGAHTQEGVCSGPRRP